MKCPQFPIGKFKGDKYFQQLILSGKFGIEKEHVRVDQNGHLALTPHPSKLGNKAEHPFITTDFSESQIEMITPPLDSLEEAYGFLKTLHSIVLQGLPDGENLWLQSMPPVLPDEDEIPLAQFEGRMAEKTVYREYLSTVYGKSRQMISGSHFNFSFSEQWFNYVFAKIPEAQNKEKLKAQVYLKVLRNMMRYRWLLVGILGRSPRAHSSLKLKSMDSEELLSVCCEYGVSIRSSKIGYRNPHPLVTDYSCIEGYQEAIKSHVESGKLLNPNELYLPIRIKSNSSGNISHVEVRLLDLDPLDPIGLDFRSLKFLHLFILFCFLDEDSGSFDSDEQNLADAFQNAVACCGFSSSRQCSNVPCGDKELPEKAWALIERLEKTVGEDLIEKGSFADVLTWVRALVLGEKEHPSKSIIEGVEAKGFIDFHLSRGQESRKIIDGQRFRFHGFEDMELSTQLLLREAVKRGVEFDILDRNENFVRLHRLGKEEFVMQATRTSLDRYSSVLLMENKLVTKTVLQQKGIRVPAGERFCNPLDAKSYWSAVKEKAVVVKPKSTNFGLGITILKENTDESLYQRAVEIAFAEDDEILVEEFVSGKEYRFFLIGEQVVGVLHRIPANVVGDGNSTIAQLVEVKNRNPLRGTGYRTPLEKIKLGETEAMFLKEQGLDFESIPEKEQTVFLRENSNISTGGDSVDFTESIHRSYFEIASQSAKALRVNITGLDMMIEDISVPAKEDNYAIIEMNFNPAIHIHCFPSVGKNRRIDEYLLNQLGFV